MQLSLEKKGNTEDGKHAVPYSLARERREAIVWFWSWFEDKCVHFVEFFLDCMVTLTALLWS